MKKLYFLIILLISPIYIIRAEDINGELKFSEYWYMFSPKWQLSKDNFHLIDLYTTKESDDSEMKLKIRFQIRLKDNNTANSLSDLSSDNKITSYEIIPWEIWGEFNDIAINNLSLKIGKQYFEWGTADGIHPSSVLNPDDYSNPFQMGEKIPVTSLNLNYSFNNFKLYFIWIPVWTPAKFPSEFPLIKPDDFILPGTEVLQMNDNLESPSSNPEGMAKAVKLEFSLFNIDFSAGYFQGYDYLPEVKTLNYQLTGNNISQFNLDIGMYFPQMKVYSFDFTTSIAGFGLWTELGVYDYNKVTTTVTTPYGTSMETVIDDKPYASYVIGSDYNFPSGFYVNFQYSYGLPYVRGKKFLEDYFILSLKNTFFEDLLEIEMGNIMGFKRELPIKKNYELMLFQKISYSMTSDLIFSIIFQEIESYGNVLFKDWAKYDTAGITISYTF